MRSVWVIINLLIVQLCFSQNIVPNGDFENYSGLPHANGSWYLCNGWSNVNGFGIPSQWPYGSPDYFHNLGVAGFGLPNTVFATVYPYSGSAIMGFISKTSVANENYREYLSIQLVSPMIIGIKYNVSFALTNGNGGHNSGNSSNHIGIRFSKSSLFQADHEPIGGTPQIEIAGEVWDTTWQSFSFIYTADSSYNYITIGNFYNDSSTSSTFRVNANSKQAYYFIDKIEVIPSGAQIIGDSVFCLGDSVSLHAISNTPISWVDSLNPNLIISNNATITVSPTITTTYLIYSSNDTISFTLKAKKNPTIAMGNDTILCQGEGLLLNAAIANANYLWQDNSTNPTFNITQQGTYWVIVNENNCSTTDTIHIDIKDCEIIFEIPNIFTPNSDGINDLFRPIISKGIISMNIEIYNRWGNKVFETNDLLIGWNGNNLTDGTYFWIVYYTNIKGVQNKLNGYVVLLR